jgi:hypothetical protein
MIKMSWKWADSSVPMTHMAVITTMMITANRVIATLEPARPSSPKNRYV